MFVFDKKPPIRIMDRLRFLKEDFEHILQIVEQCKTTHITSSFYFKYEQNAPKSILTDFEKAQSVCFVSRYEHLPVLESIQIRYVNEQFILDNLSYLRHILNEYRTIVINKSDSIYYNSIHHFCRKKLLNTNPLVDLSVKVFDSLDNDVTDLFIKMLDENNKAIKLIIKNSNFDYLYNGILQHSDHLYTPRLLEDYHSGELNYIFIKHALLLNLIKDLMYLHHLILNNITFPKLGPL
ncbi:hypothetical protein EKG37_17750 [Robertmurraya yapensis]|uniref:Uncharacterized protein n=1 Tax=Bacillus yapensis TaxID=2492960 RepID=A0A3S0INQ2_9BACI|nr:hypothetical protein [Bacillus yapensis]RTR28146.1 hypothetical protein EKG37_17750 [Bacillus yapensis]TKS94389.1 hypothetical protein FAR12_17755 [Bacillus yapensis]